MVDTRIGLTTLRVAISASGKIGQEYDHGRITARDPTDILRTSCGTEQNPVRTILQKSWPRNVEERIQFKFHAVVRGGNVHFGFYTRQHAENLYIVTSHEVLSRPCAHASFEVEVSQTEFVARKKQSW